MADDCLFCRIAAGTQPAEVVHSDDDTVAFRDINPQAPVHVLIVPRRHIASVAEAGEADAAALGRLHVVAARLARELGIADRGYRSVINAGGDAGQSVFHVHLHLLGGRRMGWPPWPR